MSSTHRSGPPRRLPRRSLGALVACAAACVGGALLPAGGCAQTPVTVATRALERSGRSAFVCLGAPNGNVRPQLPLEKCTGALVSKIDQYVGTDGGAAAIVPHLYALVTQTTRGEIAVIDTTATTNSVLDEDPAIPGATFLPIGAQPIDIVSTPGGTATFVGVAEVGREAIFALPSSQIRPASSEGTGGGSGASDRPPPEISSWPACRLPFAPGQMLLLADPPTDKGAVRESCDSPTYTTTADGDPTRDLGIEGKGRQKLVVAIPDAGGIAVIDAQALLDREPGSFDPCPVERWLPLRTDAPVVPLPPPAPTDACVNPALQGPAGAPADRSRPSGLSYAAGRLYVSDLDVPLIHVIDLPTPCEPVEIDPLLPTSLEDPTRIVTTTRVAVAPDLTPDLKRYLYAIDAGDGSAMVFDVSDETLGKLPLRRGGGASWNPFEPPDRIRYSAPAADLLIVQRDLPVTDPATGAAVEGVRCDPSPTLRATCTTLTDTTCDVPTAYRTSATYDSGAGPRKLRGTFAMLALTSGRVAVVDIDDYDAPCRAPAVYSPLFGCKAPGASPSELVSATCDASGDCKGAGNYSAYCSSTLPTEQGFCTYSCGTDSAVKTTVCPGVASLCTDGKAGFCSLDSSLEVSCNMVLPNSPRAGLYAAAGSAAGQHVPGLSIFPLLYDDAGTLIATDATSPRMVATLPNPSTTAPLVLSVGGTQHLVDSTSGKLIEDEGLETGFHHTLMMNFEDPRAHLVDQNWIVTFEGTLPGFDQKVATLFPTKGAITELRDPNSRFCDAGTHSENEVILAQHKVASDDDTRKLADYVQITASLIADGDNYWKTEAEECSYQGCLGIFGESDAFQITRDLRIVEAYQDHVEVVPRDATQFFKVNAKGQYLNKDGNVITALGPEEENTPVAATAAEIGELTRCCFPGQVTFSVRAGNQWAVRGDANGFLHHVITDPATGACRDSCDPRLARKNGRVPVTPLGTTPKDGAETAFINPMFRFAIQDDIDPPKGFKALFDDRDLQFRYTTIGSFTPLLVDLSTDAQTLIAPVGMTYVPSTGDLAVTDGSINGLILVNLASVSVTRQFF